MTVGVLWPSSCMALLELAPVGAFQVEIGRPFIAVFKIVGTAAIPLLLWAVVAAKLQTIVSHSFLHRFFRFFK